MVRELDSDFWAKEQPVTVIVVPRHWGRYHSDLQNATTSFGAFTINLRSHIAGLSYWPQVINRCISMLLRPDSPSRPSIENIALSIAACLVDAKLYNVPPNLWRY
jgi:hypothetical protein